jgi:hypothetical protein
VRFARRMARGAASPRVLLAGRLGVQHRRAFWSQDGSACSTIVCSTRRTVVPRAVPAVQGSGPRWVQRGGRCEGFAPRCVQQDRLRCCTHGDPCSSTVARAARTAILAAGPARALHAHISAGHHRRGLAADAHPEPARRGETFWDMCDIRVPASSERRHGARPGRPHRAGSTAHPRSARTA